jgi:hypothetical protein
MVAVHRAIIGKQNPRRSAGLGQQRLNAVRCKVAIPEGVDNNSDHDASE